MAEVSSAVGIMVVSGIGSERRFEGSWSDEVVLVKSLVLDSGESLSSLSES